MTNRTTFERAAALHRQGNLREAEALYQSWLEVEPRDAEALHLLGLVMAQSGRVADAIDYWRQAVKLAPHRAEMRNNLGEAYRRAGRTAEALAELEQATRLAPTMTEAWFNLANTLKDLGRLEDAVTVYRQVVAQNVNHAKAWFNLGNTLREQGKTPPAKEAYLQAIRLRGDWPEVLQNLGVTELELDEAVSALERFETGARLRPTSAEWDELRGTACHKLGRTADARAWYARSAQRSPEDSLKRLRAESLVAPIPQSEEEIAKTYSRISEEVERFAEQPGTIKTAELHTSGAEPPITLVYQRTDLKPLWSRYGDVFGQLLRHEPPPARRGKPRLGIVVTRGHEGVFAACFGGIARRLANSELEVSIVCPQSTANTLVHLCGRDAFQFLVIPARIDQAAETIRAAQIDALYYWELGTDATNYFLPYFRPTRLQIAGWGWPSTSGVEAVDVYLSAAELEIDIGASHYREWLHRLPSLPTSYGWEPTDPGSDDRASFGLRDDDHVYLCHQNLRKWHPRNDELLEKIFASDSRAKLVFIGDKQPAITRALLDRLQRNAPSAAARAVPINFLEKPRYLALVRQADVVLDTRPYGGGANTIYDAVMMNAPIVTWPDEVHRSRWAAAVLSRLGVSELVAESGEQFVNLATRVASDGDYRTHVRERMSQRAAELVQARETLAEHRDFFIDAIERSNGSGG